MVEKLESRMTALNVGLQVACSLVLSNFSRLVDDTSYAPSLLLAECKEEWSLGWEVTMLYPAEAPSAIESFGVSR